MLLLVNAASPRRGRGATAARGDSSRSLLPGVAAADLVRAADVDHVIIEDHGCHAERLHRDVLVVLIPLSRIFIFISINCNCIFQ
jgi:hypothetical protein